MWKQNRIFTPNWCVPRKVVNIHAENKSSVEEIVKSKKRRIAKSSLYTKRNKKVKDDKKCDQRFTRSEIIINLSQQKKDPMEFGKVRKRALLATASKRVKELAVPKNIGMLNSDSKKSRDPFKVRPSALKAACSPRTKMLARPKNMDNVADDSCNTYIMKPS